MNDVYSILESNEFKNFYKILHDSYKNNTNLSFNATLICVKNDNLSFSEMPWNQYVFIIEDLSICDQDEKIIVKTTKKTIADINEFVKKHMSFGGYINTSKDDGGVESFTVKYDPNDGLEHLALTFYGHTDTNQLEQAMQTIMQKQELTDLVVGRDRVNVGFKI